MQRYVVYRTIATDTQPVGYVVNAVLWDGKSSWAPPNGMAVIQNDILNIGDTYNSNS